MSQAGLLLQGTTNPIDTLTGNTGTATPVAGNVNVIVDISQGTARTTGAGNTLTFTFSDANNNTGAGKSSLIDITTGNSNSAYGLQSLEELTTGSFNSAFGLNAGINYIAAESSNIVIGNSGTAAESNVIRIGTQGAGAGQQNLTFVAGVYNTPVGALKSPGVVLADNVGQIGSLGAMTNGQLVIGSTNALPVVSTLTAGTGISITNGTGSITINGVGGGITWSVITVNQTAAVNNGYICNKAGTLALALPATSAVGDMIRVTGINTALGWQIIQAAGQQIFFGATSTTLGATGTLTSSATRDVIEIVCIAANTTWQVLSCIGNITVV